MSVNVVILEYRGGFIMQMHHGAKGTVLRGADPIMRAMTVGVPHGADDDDMRRLAQEANMQPYWYTAQEARAWAVGMGYVVVAEGELHEAGVPARSHDDEE